MLLQKAEITEREAKSGFPRSDSDRHYRLGGTKGTKQGSRSSRPVTWRERTRLHRRRVGRVSRGLSRHLRGRLVRRGETWCMEVNGRTGQHSLTVDSVDSVRGSSVGSGNQNYSLQPGISSRIRLHRGRHPTCMDRSRRPERVLARTRGRSPFRRHSRRRCRWERTACSSDRTVRPVWSRRQEAEVRSRRREEERRSGDRSLQEACSTRACSSPRGCPSSGAGCRIRRG